VIPGCEPWIARLATIHSRRPSGSIVAALAPGDFAQWPTSLPPVIPFIGPVDFGAIPAYAT
jgi:hypothetical protein